MAEIVLARIDDRLLHGQVSRRWLQEVKANTIIVADDKVSKDEDEIKILDVATPLGIKSYFLSLDDTIEKIKNLDDESRVILLVENPKNALDIINKGLNIEVINLGNKSRVLNSKEITPSIYLTNDDIKYLSEINGKGVEIMILSLPDDKLIKFEDIK